MYERIYRLIAYGLSPPSELWNVILEVPVRADDTFISGGYAGAFLGSA